MAIKKVGTTIFDREDKSEQAKVMGAMPYQAGVWDANTPYTRNEKSYPVVEWVGQHYRLNKFTANTPLVGGNNPALDYANNGANATWVLADQAEMYIIGALFAKFAKLNSFIFADNKMFSQQGNGLPYTDEGFVPNLMLNALDGSANLGNLKLDASGMLYVEDPITRQIKFKINSQSLPPLDVLMGLVSPNSRADNGVNSNQNKNTTLILPNSMSASLNGGDIQVNISQVTLSSLVRTSEGYIGEVFLLRNGSEYSRLAFLVGGRDQDPAPVSINRTFSNVQGGSYSIGLTLTKTTAGDVGQVVSLGVSTSTMTWKLEVEDIQRFEYGLNGMMAFYSLNHLYMDEIKGLDIRGKTNMPGTLLSATVGSTGGWSDVWGAKKSNTTPAKNSTGKYTVNHTIGHSRYQITATSLMASRSCHIVSKGNTSFVIEWRTIASAPVLIDTTFDIVLTGDNYA